MFKTRVVIPTKPTLSFIQSKNVTQEDIELCKRLISAYQESMKHFSADEISGMWNAIIKSHYGELSKALDTANPKLLATELSSMFQQSFMRGMSSADTWKSKSFGSELILSTFLEKVVHLAEYLGVVRTESRERGIIGYAFKDGLDELIAKIENALGISIGFPHVGAPYGVKVGNSLITPESLEHIYVASRINHAINLHLRPDTRKLNVVEIGAGFGGTAYWLLKSSQKDFESYTIIDLPLMNVMQGYFLSKVFGAKSVSLNGEEYGNGKTPLRKQISIMPTYYITQMSDENTDVLINENSMPEMTEQVVFDYLRWAKANVRGIFYSYNHEAYCLVPEIIERVAGFKRLSRNCSWTWDGHVEEVYAVVKEANNGESR